MDYGVPYIEFTRECECGAALIVHMRAETESGLADHEAQCPQRRASLRTYPGEFPNEVVAVLKG